MTKDAEENPITDKLSIFSISIFVSFDSGATHSFVSNEYVIGMGMSRVLTQIRHESSLTGVGYKTRSIFFGGELKPGQTGFGRVRGGLWY